MATAEGTRRLLARAVERGALHKANVRLLPRGPHRQEAELSCSAIGFGGYRVGGGDAELQAKHVGAVRAAFRSGVNLLDTSSHYAAKSVESTGLATAESAHGLSERLLGRALSEAIEADEVSRDGVILCTKLGHVARGRAAPPGSVPVNPHPGSDEDWHTIDPEFVEEEVMASNERLGTPPDFVLLHNPEYFLSHLLNSRQRPSIADAWEEMYERIEKAFRMLEALCDRGAIGTGYGVSSNFLSCMISTTGRPNLYEALALDRVVDSAVAVAGDNHRFRLAQLPVNLIENGGVLGRGEVCAEAAEGDCALGSRLGVGVIANRPLNAIPPPGVSAGDWGSLSSKTHVKLRAEIPMGPVQALLQRVLVETLAEDGVTDVDWAAIPLQQIAIQLSLSAPGVSSCLLGMRSESYVDDAAAALRAAPLSHDAVHRSMKKMRYAMEEIGGNRRGLW